MKKTKRLWALLLAMVMALGLISTAFAAPTIDSGRKASLSLYKYDITAASEDGAWNTASYVSTGVQDDAVTDKLAQYAIQGVEFTYLRVADIAMNNELVDGQRQVGVLYGFAEGTVLQAIGLTAADAHKSENGTRYGADYFRHIDRLQAGDMVTITNLWETLTYAVVDMEIIQPDQVDKIKIQPGRDLLTLITCHPYASGGRQRLVVYCERRE